MGTAHAFVKRPRKISAIKQKSRDKNFVAADTFSASSYLQLRYHIRPPDCCQMRPRQPRCDGLGPMLGAEHLARHGLRVSRETLLRWMNRAGF